MELIKEFQPLPDDVADGVMQRFDPLKVRRLDQGLFGDIDAGHKDRNARFKDDLCRFRIHQDVEFRGRCPVPEQTAAAHQADALDAVFQFGVCE